MLIYKILKAACLNTDAWPWTQKNNGDGRNAWLTLVEHDYDGYSELKNKSVERAKMEILRLHYKDEKAFPHEKYVTKLKENFYLLEKDASKQMPGSQQVQTMLHGMNTTDAGIEATKTPAFHSMRNLFDTAVEFMSAHISNRHAGAHADYANRHGAGGRG
jgi:hypothetical protein